MSENIAAGIVVFNPDDKTRFLDSINSVLKQFPRVYLFDNSTKEIKLPKLPKNVVYMTEHVNKGIAYALNRMMERAESEGYDWLVTMDQDSVLPDNLVQAYLEHVNDDNIAIICPQVIDVRRDYMEIKSTPTEEFVPECITSGSCTSIKVWKKLGGFDEWLFIDLVDNEFCKRVVASGYKILQLNNLLMNQEFGKIIPKNKRVKDFWVKLSKKLDNPNLGKLSYKKYVSPMRVYYTNRNIIYVNKKLKLYGPTAYQNYHCNGYLGFWFCFNIPSILRAQDKKAVIKAIYNGRKQGKMKQVEEWVVK